MRPRPRGGNGPIWVSLTAVVLAFAGLAVLAVASRDSDSSRAVTTQSAPTNISTEQGNVTDVEYTTGTLNLNGHSTFTIAIDAIAPAPLLSKDIASQLKGARTNFNLSSVDTGMVFVLPIFVDFTTGTGWAHAYSPTVGTTLQLTLAQGEAARLISAMQLSCVGSTGSGINSAASLPAVGPGCAAFAVNFDVLPVRQRYGAARVLAPTNQTFVSTFDDVTLRNPGFAGDVGTINRFTSIVTAYGDGPATFTFTSALASNGITVFERAAADLGQTRNVAAANVSRVAPAASAYAASVTSQGVVVTAWEHQVANNTFLRGFSPMLRAPNDLAGVTRLRPVFVCVSVAANLDQPPA